MGTETEPIKKRAPTLYAIIAIKILKGLLFVSLAVVAYTLSDNDLPAEYKNLLVHLKLNPERKFWADLATRVGEVTESQMIRAAVGTLIYSMFSLVEGIGLMFRIPWAGWMAIGESAFFIPIEIYELVHRSPDPARRGHPVLVLVILGLNIFIVWYLFQNRHRLFRHHHHSHSEVLDAQTKL
jgi:uncharacterized membrane protein (DUF2068 family)